MVWIADLFAMSLALFGLGLGWASRTSPRRRSSSTVPRSRSEVGLVGFSDLLSGFTCASLALLGGLAYTEIGVGAVGVGATIAQSSCPPS